ncbi:MAG: hypothetical protein FWH52_03015 [Synergistaceae bacterium]|nr:hypothetical protein [Synergistaceae bacterium]
MSRNVNFICFLVVLLCLLVAASIFYAQTTIDKLKIEYENLTIAYNNLSDETTKMEQRKQAFINAFTELEKLKVGVGENVDFYYEVQQAIHRGGARALSNAPNPPKDGKISMRMSFVGDYYSIITAFAELRGLPNVVRVVTMNLSPTNPDRSVNSEIRADVLLEAIAYSSR